MMARLYRQLSEYGAEVLVRELLCVTGAPVEGLSSISLSENNCVTGEPVEGI